MTVDLSNVNETLLAELESYLYRLVAHPDDAADLRQQALLEALQRSEDAPEGTDLRLWVLAASTSCGLAFLKEKRQWGRLSYQNAVAEVPDNDADRKAMTEVLSDPELRFDPREHVAFCHLCQVRTLAPEEAAAHLLLDVLRVSADDAASALGQPVDLVEALAASARDTLADTYEELCALQNPDGQCSLCTNLFEGLAPDQRAEPLESIGEDAANEREAFQERLRVVNDAELMSGSARGLHDFLLRGITRREKEKL